MLLLFKIRALLLKGKMNTKNKPIIRLFVLVIFLILSANLVFSDCPAMIDAAYELRSQLRTIVLTFLNNPASSPYSINEILDLLDFYKNEKDKASITDCNTQGSRTGTEITAIMEKTIVFQTQCDDNADNDGDGKIDLNDAGCASLSDDDETNCGDNKCEGPETCSTCSLDCCPTPGILFMKGLDNAISFNDNGDVILKGTIQQNSNPQPISDDEFIVRDSSGANVAIVNLVTGNMVIKGGLFENQLPLNPSASSNDFIVKDSNSNTISFIDEQGNFHLKGALTENGNP